MFLYSLGKIGEHAQHNDAILLVIVPASQASEISSCRALKTAKEYDPDSECLKFSAMPWRVYTRRVKGTQKEGASEGGEEVGKD